MTDWKEEREASGERAREILVAADVSSAMELVRCDRSTSLVEIAKRVPGLTAWDLSRLLRLEVRPSELEWLARRVLVGELREALGTAGWATERTRANVSRYLRAFGSWEGLLGRDLQPRCNAVLERLESMSPPEGWSPLDVDDALLTRAFEAWTDV